MTALDLTGRTAAVRVTGSVITGRASGFVPGLATGRIADSALVAGLVTRLVGAHDALGGSALTLADITDIVGPIGVVVVIDIVGPIGAIGVIVPIGVHTRIAIVTGAVVLTSTGRLRLRRSRTRRGRSGRRLRRAR